MNARNDNPVLTYAKLNCLFVKLLYRYVHFAKEVTVSIPFRRTRERISLESCEPEFFAVVDTVDNRYRSRLEFKKKVQAPVKRSEFLYLTSGTIFTG